ncbi:hypothetical protein HG530_011995 [Fusarium avenaceum]|nr:hypothetical protein HG530_011995 [Fusarium avenaceum]
MTSEVVLVQSVSHNLDVELVKVLVAKAALEIWSKRGLDKHAVVQLFDVGSNTENRHSLEPAEGVASLKKLTSIALMERAGDKKGDIVNHVAVGDVVHESGKRADSLGAYVSEF